MCIYRQVFQKTRPDLEEADPFGPLSAKFLSNTIKETNKQVKQAMNKKRRAYNKISAEDQGIRKLPVHEHSVAKAENIIFR